MEHTDHEVYTYRKGAMQKLDLEHMIHIIIYV